MIKEVLISVTTVALGLSAGIAIKVIGSDGEAAAESGAAIRETVVSVERVIDGDTVVTSAGTVRLLGIDAPEKGACGYNDATVALSTMLQPGKVVGLVATDKDTDQYNRLLRYIKVDETDAGYQLIRNEVADARYDSRDGYSSHPLEKTYREADMVPNSACELPPPVPVAPVEPGQPAAVTPTPTKAPKKFVIVPSPDFFTPEYFPPQYFPPTPEPVITPPGTVITPAPIPSTSPPTPDPTPTPTDTSTPEPEPTPTETGTPTPDPTPTETSTPDPTPTETSTPSPDPTPTETFTPDPTPTETFIPLPEPTETFTLPPEFIPSL